MANVTIDGICQNTEAVFSHSLSRIQLASPQHMDRFMKTYTLTIVTQLMHNATYSNNTRPTAEQFDLCVTKTNTHIRDNHK